ncbi:hypothetical protein GJ633_09270 [Halorubrum sp. CBA1125]|uniref:DUF5518 domain-containing protein n=1 Tax=Halorubrum sp. CBA1125 TaxID=2668072 RepID=UPI0012E811B1|nr:DUF5518 domain-containing protein [Halorubrum sp. CBA1125]MUW14831.1 hypothetical protein [Halorubrum sp. CBA1125]
MSVSDHQRTREPDSHPRPETRWRTLRDGLVGGTVAAVLSFLPLSEVLGGGIAGYLNRDTGRNGVAVGAIAGFVAFLPYLLVGLSLAASPGIALPGPDLGLSRAFVIAGAAGVAFVYVAGLSALGSLLGNTRSD